MHGVDVDHTCPVVSKCSSVVCMIETRHDGVMMAFCPLLMWFCCAYLEDGFPASEVVRHSTD